MNQPKNKLGKLLHKTGVRDNEEDATQERDFQKLANIIEFNTQNGETDLAAVDDILQARLNEAYEQYQLIAK